MTTLAEMARSMREALGASRSGVGTFSPQAGPQTAFYESTAEEVLYGGAAGGGKSLALAALPIRWLSHPNLMALFLRRTTPQLEDLLKKARWVYKTGLENSLRPFRAADPGAQFRGDKGIWTFSSGAQAKFGHCENKDDWLNYQGHEYQIIGFDELTHFTEQQYLEIKSRLRSGVDGLPRMVRATTNPGGPGHGWVFKRWAPWLDPDCKLEDWSVEWLDAQGRVVVIRGKGLPPRTTIDGRKLPPGAPGQILYVAKIKDVERFSAEPFDVDGVPAPTRTFIPARLEDNPALLAADPGYRQRLRDNDPVRRKQLEEGDWLVKPGAGRYFRREWVTFVDRADVPLVSRRARGWDKAATEPSPENRDPDWTRGVRMSYANDRYYIEDLVGCQAGPGVVKALIRSTAEVDGKKVWIRIAQDPGAAGKSDAADDVRRLDGFRVETKTASGDKVTRFGGFASQASPASTGGEKGRVCIVRAPWNEELIRELEEFPDGDHDDIADAISDAYDELQGMPDPKPAPPPPPVDTWDYDSGGIG